MRASEWIAFLYFVYVGATGSTRAVSAARRLFVMLTCAAACAGIWTVAHRAPDSVRDWAPGLYVLAGYYASAFLFVAAQPSLEAWLMSWDVRLLGDPSRRFAEWPRAVIGVLEIIYMGCFLMVAGGYFTLIYGGHRPLADRYWTMVLIAELGSFAPLAFIQTRPPWALERKPQLADRAIHEIASTWTQQLTIRANTFPSGHVAGSLAVALAVAPAMPVAGGLLFLLAFAISVGCIVGRYHYAIDAIAGALLAIAAFVGVTWWGV